MPYNKLKGTFFGPFFIFLFVFLNGWNASAQAILRQQEDRWQIQPNGSIQWNIAGRLPHKDHVEMSGGQVSLWLQYEVTAERKAVLSRTVVFPAYRVLPNDTHGSLMYTFKDADLPRFFIDGKPLAADIITGNPVNDFPQQVTSINQKGIVRINSELGSPSVLKLEHSLFPSVDKAAAIERFMFTNISNKAIKISMEWLRKEIKIDSALSTPLRHSVILQTIGDGTKLLQGGQSVEFAVCYSATDTPEQTFTIDAQAEETGRQQRIAAIQNLLQIETPDTLLNTAFAFAKIRATESIFKTKGGYMHGPGGLRYYAAIWANDQAEYVNPFFGWLGDPLASQSVMNSFRLFAKYINPEFKPIPSSIVAEGDSYWGGAGDRGDMAMIAYGASRFALANGNIDSAKALWPLIEWSLAFSKRKLNGQGVVTSDADELEGRFPAGKANLNTSALYYDALNSAAILSKLLGLPVQQSKQYQQEATALKACIEKYFGATVEGFATYRYYEGNDKLRAWIATPLVMDIFDRKAGTIDALFSAQLWTEDGLASLSGNKTFWDRSTLYGLRGVLAAGETERAMKFLKYYSRRRLLGEHVPYPVEAYPEGSQRHLSAESGLYCRIFTEGLFGMRPTGFNSFTCTPRLPAGWDKMALKNIHAFGNVFDLEVVRGKAGKLAITITNGKLVKKCIIKEGVVQKIVL